MSESELKIYILQPKRARSFTRLAIANVGKPCSAISYISNLSQRVSTLAEGSFVKSNKHIERARKTGQEVFIKRAVGDRQTGRCEFRDHLVTESPSHPTLSSEGWSAGWPVSLHIMGLQTLDTGNCSSTLSKERSSWLWRHNCDHFKR